MSKATDQPILSLPCDSNTHLPMQGSANGTTVVSDPLFGSCLLFNGTSDSITFPDQEALHIATYTAEVWIWRDSLFVEADKYEGILGKPGRDFNIWLGANGQVCHRFRNSTNEVIVDASNVFKPGQWNHVAITNDGTTAMTYVNGIQKNSVATGGSAVVHTNSLHLGDDLDEGSRANFLFTGRMARLRLYGRALSADEVFTHYAADLNAKSDLVLHLPGNSNTNLPLGGTVQGTTIQNDPVFGQCLVFNGSSDCITFPYAPALQLVQYTAEAWIRPEVATVWQGILGKPGRDFQIWVGKTEDKTGFLRHRFSLGADQDAGTPDTEGKSIQWNQWTHVAITNDGTTARTYINGVEQSHLDISGNVLIHRTPLHLGRTLDDDLLEDEYFKGRIAHVRFYGRALSPDEILADIGADLEILHDGRLYHGAAHPLAFTLRDANFEGVLYTLGTPQTLTLGIVNMSRGQLTPDPLSDSTASSSNCHFALSFRAGTLDRTRRNDIQLTAVSHGSLTDWAMVPGTEPDGIDCLYFLWRTPRQLAPLDTIQLTLERVAIDPRGGTRSTNVELRYDHLNVVGRPIRGRRENHISVLNEYSGGIMALDQFRVDALPPLRAEVVDVWGTVLNTVDEISLTVRISASPVWIAAGKTPRITSTPDATALTLLAGDSQLTRVAGNVTPSGLSDGTSSQPPAGTLATITGTSDLATAATVTLKVKSDINTPRATQLDLVCENVAWGDDGHLSYFPTFHVAIPLRFGPLLIDAQGNVGIAGMAAIGTTNNPLITLAVGDSDTGLKHVGDDQLAICTRNVERLVIDQEGNVGIGTPTLAASLDVHGKVGITGDATIIGNVGITGNVAVGTTENPLITLAVGDADTGLKHLGDDKLAISTRNVERLVIDENGNVGIGTGGSALAAPLEVKSTSDVLLKLSTGATGNPSLQLCQGGQMQATLRYENGSPGFVKLGTQHEPSAIVIDPYGSVAIAGNLSIKGEVKDGYGPIAPVGSVMLWPAKVKEPPKGWLLCNGGKQYAVGQGEGEGEGEGWDPSVAEDLRTVLGLDYQTDEYGSFFTVPRYPSPTPDLVYIIRY